MARRRIIQVTHAELLPFTAEPGKLARLCPVCDEGALLLRRHPETLVIEPLDVCSRCGAVVEWRDLAELRRKDWASHE